MKTTKTNQLDRAFARQQARINRERNAMFAEVDRHVAALDRNANDYHEKRIDHDTFHARNQKIWRAAETDRRVVELILEALVNR